MSCVLLLQISSTSSFLWRASLPPLTVSKVWDCGHVTQACQQWSPSSSPCDWLTGRTWSRKSWGFARNVREEKPFSADVTWDPSGRGQSWREPLTLKPAQKREQALRTSDELKNPAIFGTIPETIELPVFFPPFSQFELCFLSLATKRFMLIEERNGSRTTWTLRRYEVGAESRGGHSLSASAAWTTRDESWRGTWMRLLKDWQGYVLTLGASDINEGWQVERMWILQGVCCGHAEHHPEVRGPECGLMCGHRCTELVAAAAAK